MPPSDQEPRYRLVDSNGNVVGALWGDGNGNVKIADETDTQATFGPGGINTPALEANKAVIDGQVVEKVDSYTQNGNASSNVTVDFTGLEVDGDYFIRYTLNAINTDSCLLTFNGVDSSGNGQYEYWDETGTPQSADNIPLYDLIGDFPNLKSTVVIRLAGIHAGVNHPFSPGRPNKVSGFSQAGGFRDPGGDNVTQISIRLPKPADGDTVNLWRGYR